ncbi:MAG: endonuclease/exonuclease/phosphatase family protein, partial [Rhodothermales bacterium]
MDALLLAAFGLGFAAAYLHPRHLWWTELIAVGLPYLAILVGLGAVWTAARRRWRLLAVHGVLLLLALFRFAPLERLAASSEPAPDDLTLLTFNLVRYWGAQEGREARVMDYFRAVQPDLIALQEAFIIYSPRSPGGRPAPHLTFVVDSLGYHPARLEGLSERLTIQDPVLARMPLGEQTVTPLPKPPSDIHPPRLVGVEFRWQGREAVLYNIHLRSFGPGKPWQEENRRLLDPRLWKTYYDRYHEAYLLRAVEVEAIVRTLKQETRPYLLCGDFNSTPHNWAYHHLVRELDLQDAFEVAGKGWGST